jgi:hypothetical protein
MSNNLIGSIKSLIDSTFQSEGQSLQKVEYNCSEGQSSISLVK